MVAADPDDMSVSDMIVAEALKDSNTADSIDKTIGTMQVSNSTENNTLTQDESKFVQNFTNQTAMVQNATNTTALVTANATVSKENATTNVTALVDTKAKNVTLTAAKNENFTEDPLYAKNGSKLVNATTLTNQKQDNASSLTTSKNKNENFTEDPLYAQNGSKQDNTTSLTNSKPDSIVDAKNSNFTEDPLYAQTDSENTRRIKVRGHRIRYRTKVYNYRTKQIINKRYGHKRIKYRGRTWKSRKTTSGRRVRYYKGHRCIRYRKYKRGTRKRVRARKPGKLRGYRRITRWRYITRRGRRYRVRYIVYKKYTRYTKVYWKKWYKGKRRSVAWWRRRRYRIRMLRRRRNAALKLRKMRMRKMAYLRRRARRRLRRSITYANKHRYQWRWKWIWRYVRGRRVRYRIRYRTSRTTTTRWTRWYYRWVWRTVGGRRVKRRIRYRRPRTIRYRYSWRWGWRIVGGRRYRYRYRYRVGTYRSSRSYYYWQWRWEWKIVEGQRIRYKYRFRKDKDGKEIPKPSKAELMKKQEAKKAKKAAAKKNATKKDQPPQEPKKAPISSSKFPQDKGAKKAKESKKKQNPKWNPHLWKPYLRLRNKFIYGERMTIREAKFYLARYSDLRKAFGSKNYKAAINHWRLNGRKEKRNKLAYKELSDKEAQCYLDRYPEIKPNKTGNDTDFLAIARKHYFSWGFFEHRNRYCANRITDIQAKCYLNRYPDLQNAFGKDIRQARKHYYTYGYKEKRSYHCEGQKHPSPCGVTGEKCRCNGVIHYARRNVEQEVMRDFRQSKIDSWTKVSNFKFMSQKVDGKKAHKCNGELFGGNPNPNYPKQCFCEAQPRKEPRKCAAEGEWCRCKGLIVYGQKKVGNKTQNFEQTIANKYKWFDNTNTTKEKIACSNFALGDPKKGVKKQCFCDDVGKVNIDKLKADKAERDAAAKLKREKALLAKQKKYDEQQKKLEEEKLKILAEKEKKLKEEQAKKAEEEKKAKEAEYERLKKVRLESEKRLNEEIIKKDKVQHVEELKN